MTQRHTCASNWEADSQTYHRGHDNVSHTPRSDRFGCVNWLILVRWRRRACGIDSAKFAASRASVTCTHEW
eukprot:scaffold168067_cov23-Tisochrysis_lutea.AAC.1